jgi:hypothetical protein
MPYQAPPPPTHYQQQPPPSHAYAVATPAASVVQVDESGKKSRFKLKPDGKATHVRQGFGSCDEQFLLEADGCHTGL